MPEELTQDELTRRQTQPDGSRWTWTTEQACMIVVAGIDEVDGRYTMIYDLMQFITWETEDAVREVMARLTEQGKVKGCNCGCRGDWTITRWWERPTEVTVEA